MPTYARVVVTQTWFIGEEAYEIQVAPDHDADTARTTLLTRDPSLYTMALMAEGYEVRFDAVWRVGRRKNGARCQILESLELVS